MTTDLGQQLLIGVRARYADQTYTTYELGKYLVGLDMAWELCAALAKFREVVRVLSAPEYLASEVDERQRTLDRSNSWSQGFSELRRNTAATANARRWPTDDSFPPLVIHRLSIASPLDMTVLLPVGGSAAALYALGLLIQGLKHPDELGGWVPTLLTSWYEGMTKAHGARAEYRRAKGIRELASEEDMEDFLSNVERSLDLFKKMRAEEVEALGMEAQEDGTEDLA